jgi:hypothetical protein
MRRDNKCSKATKVETKNKNNNKTTMLKEKRKNDSKESQKTTPFNSNF